VLLEQWDNGRIVLVLSKAPRSKGGRGSESRATEIVITETRWR